MTSWFVVVEDAKSDDYIAAGGSYVVKGDEIEFFSTDQEKERVPYFRLPDSLTDVAENASKDGLLPEWSWIAESPRFTMTGDSILVLSGGRPDDKTLTFERLPETAPSEIAGSLLILENDFGPSTTLTFRLAGNTLTLDSFPTMRPAILYRQ